MAKSQVMVDVKNLPQFRELLAASHNLLLIRLMGRLDSPDGLRAWNRLLEAHDALTVEDDG